MSVFSSTSIWLLLCVLLIFHSPGIQSKNEDFVRGDPGSGSKSGPPGRSNHRNMAAQEQQNAAKRRITDKARQRDARVQEMKEKMLRNDYNGHVHDNGNDHIDGHIYSPHQHRDRGRGGDRDDRRNQMRRAQEMRRNGQRNQELLLQNRDKIPNNVLANALKSNLHNDNDNDKENVAQGDSGLKQKPKKKPFPTHYDGPKQRDFEMAMDPKVMERKQMLKNRKHARQQRFDEQRREYETRHARNVGDRDGDGDGERSRGRIGSRNRNGNRNRNRDFLDPEMPLPGDGNIHLEFEKQRERRQSRIDEMLRKRDIPNVGQMRRDGLSKQEIREQMQRTKNNRRNLLRTDPHGDGDGEGGEPFDRVQMERVRQQKLAELRKRRKRHTTPPEIMREKPEL